LRVLFIGDIVGRPGRRAVRELLPSLQEKYAPELVIANGENAAGGNGITRRTADELFDAGIDVLTMGNHIWDQKEIYSFIEDDKKIIRPANYPPDSPGRGYLITHTTNNLKVGIINLSGRIFMQPLTCPFQMLDDILLAIRKETKSIIIDFHAEATSEKMAMGWYVDGRASALVGTHTHIQTADDRILPQGTGYITDVGMTGPRDSVLGVKIEPVISKFLTMRPVRFSVASGPIQINAVILQIDSETGNTAFIQRIQIFKN
jgi:metallophosphoesterase (TIGR00282 family)